MNMLLAVEINLNGTVGLKASDTFLAFEVNNENFKCLSEAIFWDVILNLSLLHASLLLFLYFLLITLSFSCLS